MLVAVDTNVLLDQANEEGDVIEALGIIRARLANIRLIVTPTVLHELAWGVDHASGLKTRKAAKRALGNLLAWGYEPLTFVPVANGIVERISLRLRGEGVLPDEERNDASVLAEAALTGCQILLSADMHLIQAQTHPAFRKILADFDVEEQLIVARPRVLARRE